MIIRFVIVLAILALGRASVAQVLWDETTQGDISSDRLSPTIMSVVPGDNFLFGILAGGDESGHIDRDYFTITIPAGHQLSQIVLGAFISVDFAAFFGVAAGPVFPVPPEKVTPADPLGWVVFGAGQVGSDLLPLMGASGQGFTPPLPAGTYSFWAQQTDDYTEWSADFVVEEIPAPPVAVVLALVAARAARRRVRG